MEFQSSALKGQAIAVKVSDEHQLMVKVTATINSVWIGNIKSGGRQDAHTMLKSYLSVACKRFVVWRVFPAGSTIGITCIIKH